MTLHNNNNELQEHDTNADDLEGYVAFHLPRRIPFFILIAFIVQIMIGIWAVSAFYFGQKELQNQFRDNVATLTQQLNDLKSTIYTRNEASIQFEIIRQENMRQDQELRELRDKVRR
jgi:hypothetical protein